MKTEKVLYSIREACQILGISRSLIYSEAKQGSILIRKIGRRSVIHRDDLIQYVSNLPTASDQFDVEPK